MILVRHGESEFNVVFGKTRKDPGIRDPSLTSVGRDQIAAAAEIVLAGLKTGVIAPDSAPKRILASPYMRTLQSASILSDALDLPIEIEPLVHEHAAFSCDIGTPRAALTDHWPGIDFSALPAEVWWPTEPETEVIVDGRARRFREARSTAGDWQGTLVVSHWGFIRALTGHAVPNATVLTFDPSAPHPTGGTVVSTPSV